MLSRENKISIKSTEILKNLPTYNKNGKKEKQNKQVYLVPLQEYNIAKINRMHSKKEKKIQ